MKKLLIGLTSLVLATGAFAQSKVNFSNALGGAPAPVTVGGFTADNTYTAELVYDGSVVSSGALLGSGFFNLGEATLAGADGGSAVDLTINVYLTSAGSFAAASADAAANTAFTADLSVTPTAPTTPPSPAIGLAGAIGAGSGWSEVVIPEPSVLALGLIGAGAFIARRRRA